MLVELAPDVGMSAMQHVILGALPFASMLETFQDKVREQVPAKCFCSVCFLLQCLP